MHTNKESISEKEDKFGVLCSGRRYKRLKTRVEKGDPHSELERKEPCAIVHIVEIMYIERDEEDSQFSLITKESLSPT